MWTIYTKQLLANRVARVYELLFGILLDTDTVGGLTGKENNSQYYLERTQCGNLETNGTM